MSMDEASESTRRGCRLRLRTLLIVVLVFCVPLPWLSVRMERAKQQREVVEAVMKLGGGVRYDYHDSVCDPAEHPPVPSLLLHLLGDDFFSNVVGVGFFSPDVLADDDLALLGDLPHLDFVELVRVPISDNGLLNLKGLHSLTYLNLTGTSISDAGIDHLKTLRKLKRLDLTATNVTAEGVASIRQALPSCTIVSDFGAKRH